MGRSQRHIREERKEPDSSGREHGPNRLTLPTLSGTVTVGQTLTGTNGTFQTPLNGGAVTVTRAWTRDGVPISGATNATYVLQAADQGKRVRFRNIATSSNTRFRPMTVDSAPTVKVP